MTAKKTPAVKSGKSTRAPVTVAEPLALTTSRLSLAAWAMVYATKPGRPFVVLDAPASPTDRCVRFLAATNDLHVQIAVPLASKPGRNEPRVLKGGAFDTRALKSLDGLGWSNEPCTLARGRGGLRVEGPVFGPRPLTISEVKGGEFLAGIMWPTLPAEADAVEEVTLMGLHDRAEIVGVEKGALPGTMLAALSILDRVSPSSVKVKRYGEAALLITGQQDGLGFDLLLPLTKATRRLTGGEG